MPVSTLCQPLPPPPEATPSAPETEPDSPSRALALPSQVPGLPTGLTPVVSVLAVYCSALPPVVTVTTSPLRYGRADVPLALVRATVGRVVGGHVGGADRPHRDGRGDADEAGADRERVGLHLLAGEREDGDVLGGLTTVVVPAMYAATEMFAVPMSTPPATPTNPPADTACDGQRLEVVGRVTLTDWSSVRAGGRVDRVAGADERLGGHGEHGDPDAAGDTGEAGADRGGEAEDVLAGEAWTASPRSCPACRSRRR